MNGPKLLPILAILGYFTLLHALTHAEARLIEPLQTLLLIVTAGALMRVIGKADGSSDES